MDARSRNAHRSDNLLQSAYDAVCLASGLDPQGPTLAGVAGALKALDCSGSGQDPAHLADTIESIQTVLGLVREEAMRQAKRSTPLIPAEVRDDRGNLRTPFDATPWFRAASDEDILALARIDWGGDTEADAVAEFARLSDSNVGNFFATRRVARMVCQTPSGYECSVDGDKALAWLQVHRPTVWTQLQSLVTEDESLEDHSRAPQ